ncbi:histidine--tRNA ligase [Salsipaludibacter albus]|uniref:histidine--tRNA ligase n=1 Tax=Salsipaludibacter albus TaxID=2849650 RepID=UPI001EE3CA18|nr:histidine--tRNA ligase [Salsipaludibacter albus]MBY5163953.1 histidine--tRNA ligase [Salsipaludibacter albus]
MSSPADLSTDPASGTRDFLPAAMAVRHRAFDTIRAVFDAHGFAPLDTPSFERLDVLTGKYGEEGDQLMFKILRRGEHEDTGEADLALRYDLTVPLARVVARYGSQLVTPFKRYHVAPVWRADRPGHGRYREFFQCDVDVVGSDSLVADASTIAAASDALAALGLEGFHVQLNSRKALRGLVAAHGIDPALETDTLVALDKLDKIGLDGVLAELDQRGIPGAAIDTLGSNLAASDPAEAVRERLESSADGRAGLAEVDTVASLLDDLVPGGTIGWSPVLARGLSYYTGPVWEFVHDGLDTTIASGGRYDGLVGMFSGNDLPATGSSLGIERILLLLAEQEQAPVGPDVVVTVMDDDGAADAMATAAELRAAGFSADLWVGTGKFGKQLKYADRRDARLAVIAGAREREAGTVAVKQLASGDQVTIERSALVDHVRSTLA